MISTPIAFGQFTEYRDTENGFSIKYPTSWVATEESSHDGKWSQFFFASELKQGEGIPNLSVSYFTDFFTNDNFNEESFFEFTDNSFEYFCNNRTYDIDGYICSDFHAMSSDVYDKSNYKIYSSMFSWHETYSDGTDLTIFRTNYSIPDGRNLWSASTEMSLYDDETFELMKSSMNSFTLIDTTPSLPKQTHTLGDGKFKAHYAQTYNPNLEMHYFFMKEGKILDTMADRLNEIFVLPYDVTISSDECGTVNAFYYLYEKKIVLCYEFIDYVVTMYMNMTSDTDKFSDLAAGTLVFVLFHELGHALIDVYDLPIFGSEEDAVDQLSTMILVDTLGESAPPLIAGASGFFLIQAQTQSNDPPFLTEHSLDIERFYNILCWAYGSDPSLYDNLIKNEILPQSRAIGCTGEFDKITDNWPQLLEPHFEPSYDDSLPPTSSTHTSSTHTSSASNAIQNIDSNITINFGTDSSGCENSKSCYSPYQFTVGRGSTVTWYNADSASHTVTSGSSSTGPDGSFDSGLLESGSVFSHKFNNDGVENYFCTIHPWMKGQIVIKRGGIITGLSIPQPTFLDTTPPKILKPDDIVVDAKSQYGTKVIFEIVTNDDTDSIVNPSCNINSGILFEIGETKVTCNAMDSSGNRAVPVSFTVTVNPEKPAIPDWVKNVASYWCDNAIDDTSFVEGIQYLIDNNIIAVSAQSNTSGSQEIPEWVKNNACWWSSSVISDDDFATGIEFLVTKGIIQVQ